MSSEKSGRKRHVLRYPQHLLQPEDLLTFIQMDGFGDDWEELGLLDIDLQALEIMIMVAPTDSPVVQGTGGLRKIRFARADRNEGKSGGARVCYTYFEEFKKVLLFVAYNKNEKEDLSSEEKRAFRSIIERARAEFSMRT